MKRSNEFRLRKVGDLHILVPLGSRTRRTEGVVVLNSTAQYAWELLANDCSLHDLMIAFREKFTTDESCIRDDLARFLEVLDQMGLLEGGP